jgi:putative endonuclease
MITKKNIGNYYEKIAKNYLIENNYIIIDTNYRYKTIDFYKPLEIDIIATKNNTIFFFEIKYRKKINGFFPCSNKKIQNIIECSENFLFFHTNYNNFEKNISLIIIENTNINIINNISI